MQENPWDASPSFSAECLRTQWWQRMHPRDWELICGTGSYAGRPITVADYRRLMPILLEHRLEVLFLVLYHRFLALGVEE